MSDHDRNTEGEPVVVRDRRRVDPVTGEVRTPAEEESPAGGATPGSTPAEEDVPVSETGLDPRVEELTAEVAERTADLQRVSAEYANYRRRVDRDRESVLVGARVQFVSELLTTLDDIDRAAAHGDLTGPFKSVADKIVAVAQKQGLEPFAADGDLFDPSLHEAVQHESGDVAGPSVAVVSSVLRRGYRIADRVLRPAMVTVVDQAVDPSAPDLVESPEQ
ncbi:nucleotide exchange factor GrpE [Pseudonocardia abyssalis]|uniref:Protein GrpE n=1 Tax=Pseudonocardia abyssalis TaxID=2792008 RepID=A0ABS6V0L5_9PSEU|nr:nucleotide exchange factor GrpE [Pseudonocardia abyssalis]MBW0118040.1 nucleotide exchange factor GrpE [Pseudonocardia abyssalis]MBW0137504.1 nucleotide exchange factor GrpE [Pseudonocardia abyssalis]